MIYHIAAMLVGFLMDLLLGDLAAASDPSDRKLDQFSGKETSRQQNRRKTYHTGAGTKEGNAACTCSFEQYGVCDSCAFTWRIQTASLSWCCDREHYDLPDPCHEMPEGGEYESLSGTEKRGYCSVTESGIHDRWQRHGMSG